MQTSTRAMYCAAASTSWADTMLDEREIHKEIARLEYEESSYPNYAKLADLYAIRAEMQKNTAEKIEPQYTRLYSGAPAPIAEDSSDFMQLARAKNQADVWQIMDELMTSLQVMQPKTYSAVINKLRNL